MLPLGPLLSLLIKIHINVIAFIHQISRDIKLLTAMLIISMKTYVPDVKMTIIKNDIY